jgi:hypothetical protein
VQIGLHEKALLKLLVETKTGISWQLFAKLYNIKLYECLVTGAQVAICIQMHRLSYLICTLHRCEHDCGHPFGKLHGAGFI